MHILTEGRCVECGLYIICGNGIILGDNPETKPTPFIEPRHKKVLLCFACLQKLKEKKW